MAKTGAIITTFLFGAAAGVAVGYALATDAETRKQDMEKLKKTLNSLKGKMEKKAADMEEEIYHS